MKTNRSTSLWVGITQDGKESMYKVKTVFNVEGVAIRRILTKFIEGVKTSSVYTVDESNDRMIPPWQSNCTCTCPSWQTTRQDCKHILALQVNALINVPSTIPHTKEAR